MRTSTELAKIEKLFLALSDKTRLRLLNLMRDGDVFVGLFTEVLGESQPKISRHLAYLRNAGIVEARRDGKWIYYRIVGTDGDEAQGILFSLYGWLDRNEIMQTDRRRANELSKSSVSPARSEGQMSKQTYAHPYITAQTVTDDRMPAHNELEVFLL